MNWKQVLFALQCYGKIYFKDTFESGNHDRWIVSGAKQDYGKWELSPGVEFFADPEKSIGLRTTENSRFYAISAPLDEEFDHDGKSFVLQFSVKFDQNIDCGGGYLKVLPPDFDPQNFNGDSKYNIMFGPDVCGNDRKTHAILYYGGENHLIDSKVKADTDQLTHLYTFIIHPDQTYEILLDLNPVSSGKIVDNWSMLGSETIPDETATKPIDWVDNPTMDDPKSVKPEGYDDIPKTIVDPESQKPDDWDDEMDGEWEPASIPNPEYKGVWKPNKIPNPDYKGEWERPEIPNPAYKYDDKIYAYKSKFIGFDLWQVRAGTVFDNIIVTDSVEEAKDFAKETFLALKEKEMEAKRDLEEKERMAEDERIEKARKELEAQEAQEGKDEEEKKDEDSHEEL